MKHARPRMLRFMLLLLAWATAGAIVNVAVAWGYTYRYEKVLGSERSPCSPEEMAAAWKRLALPDWHAEPDRAYFRQYVGIRQCSVYAGVLDTAYVTKYIVHEFSVGWPSYALRTLDLRNNANGRWTDHGIWRLPMDKNGFEYFDLPIAPIWPGFAFNTLFYAVILWGLFATPFALRKRQRIKRGLCPTCGYDLRSRAPANDICPECGVAVR